MEEQSIHDDSVEEKRPTKADLVGLDDILVHRKNIEKKESDTDESKYGASEKQALLKEIRERYDKWHEDNLTLVGPYSNPANTDTETIKKRVDLFNGYKDFIDELKYVQAFHSKSNLHSSALEEFLVYLFGDLVAEFSVSALLGKSRSFRDLFFMPSSYKNMVESPNVKIEIKDHDFVIGASIKTQFSCEGYEQNVERYDLKIPAVAIECKTYVDKTMLEAMSETANDLVHRNPNAIYIAVAEWLKLTEDYNLRKLKIDQVYILRKQKNTDQDKRYEDGYVKNPVYSDVVEHLFNRVREHLRIDWEGGVSYGLEKGILLP